MEQLWQLPYTYSYIIRKMQQVDNLNELPKDKRPPTDIIWDGTPDELDEWLDKVLSGKAQKDIEFLIKDVNEIEG